MGNIFIPMELTDARRGFSCGVVPDPLRSASAVAIPNHPNPKTINKPLTIFFMTSKSLTLFVPIDRLKCESRAAAMTRKRRAEKARPEN
jgi:hypothetical protein